MDKIRKTIDALPLRLRDYFDALFRRIEAGDLDGLDVLKLHGRQNLFRVRVGEWRVVFEATHIGNRILSFARRNEKTYRDL